MSALTRFLAITIFAATFASGVGTVAAAAGDEVQIGGQGQNLRGTVSRTTPGRSVAGGERATGAVTTAVGGRATEGPVITRSKREIVYDYTRTGGGKLHYVFDDSRDHCQLTQNASFCYGPKPKPAKGRPGRAPAPPPISASEVVERTIVNVRLPEPKPNIDPGYAVTGMKAYLETGNNPTHRFAPIDTVLGPLTITATSTYTVNWGDQTVTGPHSSSGGKYPDGAITHVYQHARTVDVSVTQNWTARWSLAGESGTIGGLSSSGQLPNFSVREVQAVRRR